MITYNDKIELKIGNHAPYYEVTRTHSDGVVSVKRCSPGELNGQKPEEYLDRILSQHLSGTGLQRAKETSGIN